MNVTHRFANVRLMYVVVIVRRVVAARRQHALGYQTPDPNSQSRSMGYTYSSSHTQALGTFDEKTSIDLADRPGGKTRRGGFWARLKCW